jgi:hypothetical protein
MALAEALPTRDPATDYRIDGDTRLDPRPLVVLLLAAWGFNYELKAGISTSLVAGLVSLPLWLPALRRFRYGRAVLALGALAVVAGAMQAVFLSNVRPFEWSNGFGQATLMVAVVSGIGLILWARTLMSVPLLGSVLALSVLAGTFDAVAGSPNPWKFVLSVPVAVLALSLVSRRGAWLQLAVLAVLGAVSVALDSRSFFGICLLAAGLLLAQRLGLRPAKGWLGPVTAAVAAGLAFIVLLGVGTTLATQGELGEQIAQRTQEQIERGGNIIAGGRPEWAGTLGLMAQTPGGFGFGAVPTYQDVWHARAGLDRVGIGTENTYVDNYMFDGQFKLHSTVADMWSQMGLVGLAFGLLLVVAVFVSLVDRLRVAAVTGLVALLAVKVLWDLSFSPIFSSAIWLAVAIGLVLSEAAAREPDEPGLEALELQRPPLV